MPVVTQKKGQAKKVRSILISQPEPESERSPYFDLAKQYNIKIDFRPFIHVEAVSVKEFRKSKINLLDYTAVIFTSKNSIDHFFRICDAVKVRMPQMMKYFCVTEAIALYLQKYTLYRKRKVIFADGTLSNLMEELKKNGHSEKFLLPCSKEHKQDIVEFLEENNFKYGEAVLYQTVNSDLSDLKDLKYDMIVFFSPSGIKSLFYNFPNFAQKDTRIAAFGPTTAQAVIDAGLRLDIKIPAPEAPSMAMAIENYLKEVNG